MSIPFIGRTFAMRKSIKPSRSDKEMIFNDKF